MESIYAHASSICLFKQAIYFYFDTFNFSEKRLTFSPLIAQFYLVFFFFPDTTKITKIVLIYTRTQVLKKTVIMSFNVINLMTTLGLKAAHSFLRSYLTLNESWNYTYLSIHQTYKGKKIFKSNKANLTPHVGLVLRV